MLWIPLFACMITKTLLTEDTRPIYNWEYIELLSPSSAPQAKLDDWSLVICVTFPFLFILFQVNIEVYHPISDI